jgi:Putative peptidoglycan binding domain
VKTITLISLISAAFIGLTQPTWASPHGGGGGFGGGGFGGGGHLGGGGRAGPIGGGGGYRGGGFRGGAFGFHGATPMFAGARGGGVGFGVPRYSSSGTRPSYRQGVYSGRGSRSSITPSFRATTAVSRPQNRFSSSGTAAHRGLNGRTDHIAERHDANWHRDWDRRHAHFFHNRFFVFDDGFWFGLDDGFYPWDYLPYYGDDYYPYDYYADDQSYDNTGPYNNGVPLADPTVEATQERLAQLGYYNGPVDGIFGPATRDAVANYQIANQLNVTGSLSPDTMQSLGLPQVTPS